MINKKVLLSIGIVSGLLLSINSYAYAPGMYAGIQAGWGKVHDSGITSREMDELTIAAIGPLFTRTSFDTSSKDSHGFAGRIFVGYQFDPMWSGEFGWMKFRSTTVNATAAGIDGTTSLPYTATATKSNKTSALDLVLKGMYPIQNRVSVYGKFGVAYLIQREDLSGTFTETLRVLNIRSSSESNKDTTFYPTFGLGVDFALTPNVSADLSWSRIQRVGSDRIGSTDFVSVGLIAHA